MDDCDHYDSCNKELNNGLIDSSSYIIGGNNSKGYVQKSSHPLGRNIQGKKIQDMNVQVCRPVYVIKKTVDSVKHQGTDAAGIASPIKNVTDPFCQIKLESLNQLKDSTKKLLYLLDDIQSKTYSKDLPIQSPSLLPRDTFEVKLPQSTTDGPKVSKYTDGAEQALKQLEAQTKSLNTIYVENEDDDCSIFKRLTRKCHCLNRLEYNDFIIHFNEDTKYFTSNIGEVIKNMRILKKFLYMGGKYTQNALLFLNEGLLESSYTEKVEITQGCTHADLCNVFEDNSIVVTCISWPCKLEYYGDALTQKLAASFLYKLTQLEEGRRYLKFTSKITNDIKKLLRKQGSKLDIETTELLNCALNAMHPPMTQYTTVSYHCRQNDEGCGTANVKALLHYRKYMTLAEIFTHLDLIHSLSNEEVGKTDLTTLLPSLLPLFKQMLKEYDNSEMNIIITNILNNIVSKNMLKQKESNYIKSMTMVAANVATENLQMKNEIIQMPPPSQHKKKGTKKGNKSKSHHGPNKHHQPSRRNVSEFEPPAYINRSKKFGQDRARVIVVPIDKNKAK